MVPIEQALDRILDEDPSLADLVRPWPDERRVLRWIGPEDKARGYGITPIELPGRAGTLWAGSTPGRRDWSRLPAQLGGLREAGIDQLVCLLSQGDLERLDRQAPFRTSLEARFGDGLLHVPMGDYGLPTSVDVFEAALERVDEALFAGADVLAHCGAGCGRAGTFCCCMLVRAGYDTAEAVATYRAVRGCGPERPLQVALIEWVRRRF